jgi:hypothetical protein
MVGVTTSFMAINLTERGNHMRRVISSLFVLFVMSVCAYAQTRESAGQGYTFVAPGAIAGHDDTVATMHYGVGGERFITKGFGVGAEIGYFTQLREHSSGFGILSGDATYRFRNSGGDAKVVPFVSAGYSLFFRDGTANGYNFGGGVHYWFNEKLGLRVEFRDHLVARDAATHFLGVRVGLAFR